MMSVLVTDYVHPLLLDGLEQEGFRVIYAPEIPREFVVECIEEFTGLVVNTRMWLGREEFEKATRLRFVGRLGIGLDIFDEAAAARRGIRILNTPGANANAVGEHVVGLLLSLTRNINRANRQVKQMTWLREMNRGVELQGRTIGIIGFGNTGSRVAEKFAGWGTQILAYDKYKTRYADGLRYVRETTLEEVVANSDVVSLHIPLTDETHHMVDRRFLSKCKRGVILINTARGKVVDTRHLLEALESGQVGAAALDVLENERLETMSASGREVFDRLATMENVLLTPHIAGWTVESKEQIAAQMLRAIREAVKK